MKKQARTKSPNRSKKAIADLAPRNTAGVKGGLLASSVLKKRDDTSNAIIGKV
jgi:hypothetical protein